MCVGSWLVFSVVTATIVQGEETARRNAGSRSIPVASRGWSTTRVLSDSSTHLRWAQPAQARSAEKTQRDAVTQSASARAADLVVPPELAGHAEVVKVAHEVAVGSPSRLQLQSAANAPRAAVTYVAQQTSTPAVEDAADVFDSTLEELLPGGDLPTELEPAPSQPAEQAVPAPTRADPVPAPAELPAEDFSPPDWSLESPPEMEDLNDDLNGLVEPQPLPSLNGETAEPPPTPSPVPDTLPSPDEARSAVPFEAGGDLGCESEVRIFQEAWQELRNKPLSSISLDITPKIRPTEPTESANLEQQVIQRAATRPWRDKQGRVLADGRFRGFREAHVLVEDETGQIQPVSWYELGNEELCYVSALWELPEEFSPSTDDFADRNWTMLTFTWTASALCHKPLYFEEVQLERYGHSAGPVRQAMLSGVHFFGNIFLLPYHMGLNPPNECQYALGYYRPGSCAPWLLPAYPLSARGARWEAAILIGGLLLLP